MKRNIALLSAAFFLGCAGIAFGQADTLATRSLIIKFSPQHTFLSGLHLELERSIVAGNGQSILLSPHIYKGSTSYTNSLYDRVSEQDEKTEVSGYGGAVLHRIYLSDHDAALQEGIYFSYGVDYHHFSLVFVRNGYVKEVDEEGLEYYKYRERPFAEKIDRYGAVAMAGHQGPFLHENVVTDFSFGFGYRESHSKTNYTSLLFGEGAYDYGHDGIYLLLQFKIGVIL